MDFVCKNRYEAIAHIDEAVDFIRYYSAEMVRNNGFMIETGRADANERSKSVMKPYGVWGVIAPFNFPTAILPLLTNNTYVKPPYMMTCDKCGMIVVGRQRRLMEHKQEYHSY